MVVTGSLDRRPSLLCTGQRSFVGIPPSELSAGSRVTRRGSDLFGEIRFMDHERHTGIGEEVPQLVGSVAGVDVDRDGAQLERGQHRLDVLMVVAERNSHAVAGFDAAIGEDVRQPVRPLVELAVAEPSPPSYESLPTRNCVDHRLEQVRQVPGHHRCRPYLWRKRPNELMVAKPSHLTVRHW